MATVNKATADKIVAGQFKEDNPLRIIKYQNMFDGEDAYGLECGRRELGRYSDVARKPGTEPTVYWVADELKGTHWEKRA